MKRKVVGYATPGEVKTVALGDGGDLRLIQRRTHYRAAMVAEAAAPAAAPEDVLIGQIEDDCRRWFHILQRCPLPGEYITLKRSGQAARWFDVAYEKGVDYAPVTVRKTAKGIEIEHEKPRARRSPVTAAELTWMDRMMDVLLTLGFGSLDWKLVTGRAQRRPWAELTLQDVERRRERQLRNLYRAALIKLLPVWQGMLHKI